VKDIRCSRLCLSAKLLVIAFAILLGLAPSAQAKRGHPRPTAAPTPAPTVAPTATPDPSPTPAPSANPQATPAPSPTATQTPTAAANPTFYVSGQYGNDGWSGSLPAPNSTSTDGPFRTLARAQSAMEASSIKTVTLRAGSYSLASTSLTFSSQDAGEKWLPYSNEIVTLDGGGIGYISVVGANNLTIEGLVIQNLAGVEPPAGGGGLFLTGSGYTIRWNTFLNCNVSCLSGSAVQNSLIDSNTMNGQSPGNPTGSIANAFSAIMMWNGSSNNQITHNLIENCQGGGVAFAEAAEGPPNNSNIIDRNILQDVDTNVVDMGALYIIDRTLSAVGNKITNNHIFAKGGLNYLTNQTKAIYLDEGTSNTLVSRNIVGSKTGEYPAIVTNGTNDTVINNIFDISSGGQFIVGGTASTGSSFTHNIIYSSGSFPGTLWVINSSTLPTDNTNLYFSATGASIPNTGVVDTNPFNANPGFTNPSGNDYSIPLSSPAYGLISFQTLPTDQGPVPYAP
jgi:hypothetical protein